MMTSFDLAVIGGGPGGYVASIRAAQLGLRVALVEKRPRLGGTCMNAGCIPSKALLESSGLYYRAGTEGQAHGISAAGLAIDIGRMMRRKERIVRELTDGLVFLMKKNRISVYKGAGSLAGAGRVLVERESGREEIGARHVLLATGSEAIELAGLPFDGETIVGSTEALAFERLPEHLVVVGAGAIGLELGSVWSRLGARVTIIECLPRIAPFADRQMSQALERALKKQGLVFHVRTRVLEALAKDGMVTVKIENKKGEPAEVTGDRLLVAVGRRPYSKGLGLETVGLAPDEHGRIRVDGKFATGAAGIYAVGDLIGGPMLAHKAAEEGLAIAEILAGRPGRVSYDRIPNVVYTWPELALVGLGEEEAAKREIEVKVGKFFFKANGRAKTLGMTEGLAKIVADFKTGRVLGAQIVGPHASELISEAAAAMEFRATAGEMARMVHAHPTLSEALREAAMAVDKRAIHA